MSNKLIPLIVTVVLLAGVFGSCKHPTETKSIDSTKCDTCQADTSHRAMDTTSHDFHWTEYTIPQENNLTGCWVFGPKDIIAVNNYLYRFDGSSWQKWDLPLDNGNNVEALSGFSIFGFTPSDFWLTFGGLVYHYDGKILHLIRLDQLSGQLWNYPHDGSMHSAWGTSSHDMFFVGDSGTILHFDGTNWMKFPKVTSENLQSVWGTSSNDVWASGYTISEDRSVLVHYDGSAWSEDGLSTSSIGRSTLGSVWATDSSTHPFVSVAGSLLFHKTTVSDWTCDSAILNNKTSDGGRVGIGVTGTSWNDYIVAGGWGYIGHWNGKSWQTYSQFYHYGSQGYATYALSMKAGTVCVVGIKNATSWILVGQR